MLKTTNHKGFTIIEVVITIAIGAAVMALVLNAVQGARRSQRNNARVADVGAIATAVNNYYGARNNLPVDTDDIDDPLIGQLAYYPDATDIEIAAIFTENAWDNNSPSANGNFLSRSTTVPAGHNANDYSIATAAPTPSGTPPTGGTLGGDTGNDQMALIRQASCNIDFSGVEAGGIREMVIIYKLEGQDGIICREI